MKLTGVLILAVLAAALLAQQKGPAMPPPLPCGLHGDAEVICGTRGPEDLELTPDSKFLIVPNFALGGQAPNSAQFGLQLFDIAKKSFAKLTPTTERLQDWGDPACPGPVGDALVAHGTSLVKRANGRQQLYVVNHGGGRQSIEMFELKPAGASWSLAWHGCVVSHEEFNDVAALTDGSFVATQPQAIPAPADAKGKQSPFSGQVTGYLVRWTPARGVVELPGTRTAYPNGVVATPDGRTAYYAVYGAREARRYDLRAQKETGLVKLDFMPDNLTWTRKGNLLAAGIKGIAGECPAGSGQFCRQAFTVGYIDAGKMTQKVAYDSNGKGNLIPGVSVALQAGNDVYIGAFEGDRLVKVTWKE